MLAMAHTTEKIVILCREKPKRSEMSAKKIAEFLGAETAIVSVADVRGTESFRNVVPACPALIVHLDTLATLADRFETKDEGLLALTELSPHVFVYGDELNDRHGSILKTLSLGGLVGWESLVAADLQFIVSNDYRHFCGAFSGLTFSGVDRARDSSFEVGETRGRLEVLVRTGPQPFFVRVDHGSADVFFAACSELGDPDEEISSESGLLPWFSRLVPLMIFLRNALGDRLWHSDKPQACFILDDPTLKHRYGFLKYSRLLEATSDQKFTACIAFIPWNYRRSNKEIAELFSKAPDSLSLCIHGCDHTRGEFAAMDRGLLRSKAQLALSRMGSHSEHYRLPFDDVMVFPQGLFSSEALKALEHCGYLAAVNTTVRPLDKSSALTLRELMDVAVTKFGGVPLFVRHYPREIAEFAFDLFLGKPALMVEHHGYFRNGYSECGSFVRRINAVDKNLEWRNLATICAHADLRKTMANGEVHVRFYTNRFRVTNTSSRSEQYVLQKPWSSEGSQPKLTLNGRPWPGDLRDGVLTTALSLKPNESAEIRIVLEPAEKEAAQVWARTGLYQTKVFVRRMLSEFRDDHVETNRLLRKLFANVRSLWSKSRHEENGVSEYAN